MKILFSINCYKAEPVTNNAGIVWAAAWGRFLKKNSHRLPGDFQFLNDGFDMDYFKSIVGDFPVKQSDLPCSPSDADKTYECIRQSSDEYDYVARVDPDMFPSIEALEKMVEFLKKNPDIDILSPSNAFQCFHNNGYQPYPNIENNWSFWKHSPVGDCIVFFRKEYVKECLELYKDTFKNIDRPFNAATLTYQDACALLNVKGDPVYNDTIMGIDGQININMWTIMCKKGMRQGHIVNHDNRSFKCKDHMSPNINLNTNFENLVDHIDFSKNFSDNNKVCAPFFHVGMSYDVPYHLNLHDNPVNRLEEHKQDYLMSFFRNNEYGVRAYHCAFIKILLLALGDQNLLSSLDKSLQKSLEAVNQTQESFEYLFNKILSFYKKILQEYL